jgi:hypothetical protein
MSDEDLAPELTEIHAQMPATLRFPIRNSGDLIAQLPERTYTFRSKPVDRVKGANRISADLFPIISQADFDSKISSLIRARKQKKSG